MLALEQGVLITNDSMVGGFLILRIRPGLGLSQFSEAAAKTADQQEVYGVSSAFQLPSKCRIGLAGKELLSC